MGVTVYQKGKVFVSTATFKVGGAVTDPGTVTLKVRSEQDSSETIYVYGTDSEVAKTGTGVYTGTFTLTKAGRLYIEWRGTGAAVAVDEDEIMVDGGMIS